MTRLIDSVSWLACHVDGVDEMTKLPRILLVKGFCSSLGKDSEVFATAVLESQDRFSAKLVSSVFLLEASIHFCNYQRVFFWA